MKIKKGDKVLVIAGKERGKTGTVSQALPSREMVVIDGLNIAKKHRRATRQGGKGQIIDIAMPIHVSNVQRVDASGKRIRSAKKAA
ncbi:MAG TPA: 50S ribosomal protein L24 [Candidatus Paceibacterota bacterium]|nr:50S ribosomal protein L24 [Candidatus Paceibacterota bacterium]